MDDSLVKLIQNFVAWILNNPVTTALFLLIRCGLIALLWKVKMEYDLSK